MKHPTKIQLCAAAAAAYYQYEAYRLKVGLILYCGMEAVT